MSQIPVVDGTYRFVSSVNAVILVACLFSFPMRAFSLQKMVNFFLLFFFVIANAIQYSTNTLTSSVSERLTTEDYVTFQILVFFIIVLFNVFYIVFNKRKIVIKEDHLPLEYRGNRLVLLSLVSLLLVLLYYRNDILHLFIKGFLEDQANYGELESEGAMGLIFSKFLRPIPFACLLIAHYAKISKLQRLMLFLTMLIALFPLGISRNAVAMYWLPVVLVSFARLKRGNLFVLSILVGLLVFFPFLEEFRYWTGSLSDYHYSLEFLNSMHFDSSQEFMIVMKRGIVTWGHQLLGAILFFLPRAIWPTKPIGSGAFVAEMDGAFGNISMPFWGEGFINFDLLGVLAFTLLLSFFCAYMDKSYWQKGSAKVLEPYYLLFVGAIIFVLRGDLMSSLSYTLGAVACIYVVKLLSAKKQTC